LKEYHTTPSNKKYGIDNLPNKEFRLHDEEIKSALEYERDSIPTKPSEGGSQGSMSSVGSSEMVESSPQDFDFTSGKAALEKNKASVMDPAKNAKSISSEQEVSSMGIYTRVGDEAVGARDVETEDPSQAR
jgi:hypothetical protein